MSVTFPEGALDALPEGQGEPVAAEAGVDAGALLLIAGAYQAAQYRVSRSAERASVGLFRRAEALSDEEMSAWMASWNTVLGGAAVQQAALTRAYVRSSLGRFGVAYEPAARVRVPAGTTDRLAEWADGEYGRIAPGSLRDQIRRLIDELDRSDGLTTPAGASLADRAPILHSPVLKTRWRVSEGVSFSDAVEEAASFVEEVTYNAGRAAERAVMGAQSWPTFRNGTAMMYKRVPQAGACGWCRLVATRLYSLASFKATGGGTAAPWHASCRCTWQALTFAEAVAYDRALQDSGDYFDAASRIGLWAGERPEDYTAVERQKARVSRDGDLPAAPANPPERTAEQRAAQAAATAREVQARGLVDRANALNAQARQAFAEGDSALARRLYDEARGLTTQALALRRVQ